MRPTVLRSAVLFSTLTLFGAAHGLVACGGDEVAGAAAPGVADGGADGESPELSEPPLPQGTKVDVLLVVDNSVTMGDKAKVLADSVGTLLRYVATGNDVHVGVIDTSLGTMGGDVCSASNPRSNSLSHLRTTDDDGAPVSGVTNGVLAYSGGDVESFVKAAGALVRGVGETGCGFEAQLESTYRFLVQPDPWKEVTLDESSRAELVGLDAELLAQRKAFLRNDSALVVVLLTDEDDSSADPRAVGGQGWAFATRQFPGSKVARGPGGEGTTAPRGTSVCATDPTSPDCTSCGFQSGCDPLEASCQKLRSDANCKASGQPGQFGEGYDGYYGPDEDQLNVRFQHMKERFGVDPQYPIARYVDGFTKSKVPDRTAEHPKTGDVIEAYAGTPKCTNPIFAEALPGAAGEELCNLPPGPRTPDRVLFAVLGGLPPELATETPSWTKILGQDPDAYDLAGIDPHMIQSTEPRPGLPPPSSTPGDNGPDPVHGREWTTDGRDLQYACTFELPEPRQCTPDDVSCECGGPMVPLCSATYEQVRAKAYPTRRPLRVVKALGESGVVGSICSSSYDGTMAAIAKRLASRLAK